MLSKENTHAYFDDNGCLYNENGTEMSPFDDDYESARREAEYFGDPLSDDYVREEYC